MTQDNLMIMIAFALYLGLMMYIGVYYYRKSNSIGDYILGGRQLGPWITALSAEASDMSGWMLMGVPGLAYTTGISGVWIAKLFNTIFGLDYTVSLFITAGIVVFYTFLGGFLAVSWTDCIQGALMFFAILAVPITAAMFMGGPIETFQLIQHEFPQGLSLFGDPSDWFTWIPYGSHRCRPHRSRIHVA